MIKNLLFILMTILSYPVFAQSGAGWEWSASSGIASYSPGRQIIDITSDASGNVYAVGRFQGTLTLGNFSIATSGNGTNNYNFDEDGFVVKYSPAGVPQWLKRLGKTAIGANESANFVALDPNGNVYVGLSDGNINTSGLNFLTKFDSNGNEVWSKLTYSISALDVNSFGIFVTGNDKLVSLDFDGNERWSLTNAGGGAADNFVDEQGNSYVWRLAGNGTSLTFLGQNYTSSGLSTTYLGKVGVDGTVQWRQEIKGRGASYYTVDKNGKSYIWLVGGFGDVFQGISTNNIQGFSYFELQSDGTIARYLKLLPYKGAFKVRDDGIYGFATEVGTTARRVAYGDHFINVPADNTLSLGILLKFNKTTDAVEKVNTFEIRGAANNPGAINVIATATGGKMLVGGTYGTSTTYGAVQNSVTSSSGNAPTDLFIAQCNTALFPQPAVTNWTGAANDGSWNNAANWSNGVPDGSKKTMIDGGLTNYPASIPTNASPAKIEIAAGAKLKLPLSFSAPFGIVNNGTIELTDAGAFTGTFGTTAPAAPSGTGKIVVKNAGLAFYFSEPFNQSLELDFNGTASTYGGTINGDLILTNGILSIPFEMYPLLVNNIVGGSATSYVAGKLTRKVTASGNYTFPIGTTDRYAPVSLQLNNIVGPQTIVAGFSKSMNGAAPNTTAGGKAVTSLLNAGIWTITPNAALTAGSYIINLVGRGYSNGVADAANYVVVKRNNVSSAWGFYGDNGNATQSAGVVSVTAGNITGFSDFAIGIASGAVPTTLPVKLVDFTARATGQSVLLNWETASEINNDKFLIERSKDAKHFEPLAELKGKGLPARYEFRDVLPINGINYYRLNQLDLDGTFTYSAIKPVRFALEQEAVRIYPNPVVNGFTVRNSAKDITALTLVDVSGKAFHLSYANDTVAVPAHISNGTYFVKISYSDGSKSQQKIIVKR